MALRARGRPEPTAEAPDPGTGMADDKVDLMGRVEDRHWWYRAKRDLVAEVLAGAGVSGRVLDIGCGTGAVLERLAPQHDAVIGTDLSPVAASASQRRGMTVVRSVAEAVPFRSGCADAVVSLDVIEHLDDDELALREYRRVVRPGGLVVIAVPAYQWAWSSHDVSLGHRRRYTRERLGAAARAAGLEVQRLSHFHSWLAPVAYVVRRTPVRHLVKGEEDEASLGRPAVNRLLDRVARAERAIGRRAEIPLGLSILLVATRPDPGAPRS